MTWGPLLFLVVCVAGIAFGLIRLQVREVRNHTLKDWVLHQPQTFSCRALVRQKAIGMDGAGWVTYKSPAGAQLVVRTHGIVVSLGSPFDRMMSTGRYLDARESTMWLDRVGWGGSSVGATECIRISGHDTNGSVELAVRPALPMETVWQALVGAGVRTTPSAGIPPIPEGP